MKNEFILPNDPANDEERSSLRQDAVVKEILLQTEEKKRTHKEKLTHQIDRWEKKEEETVTDGFPHSRPVVKPNNDSFVQKYAGRRNDDAQEDDGIQDSLKQRLKKIYSGSAV
ncbi:MAG: hypothetical protein ACTSXQ_06840 [Alphaproteobacteria bacterium]